ncbi:methyltransferase domain-containing protein [Acaricomes phytoseiuli]|uniref:methyltransferase domain-containing protein n=1 Tax=Acaricomes phytoseiuli TaxID=291968 RepID=UPI002222D10A|nr:methyltransferase domain-containing protein [Acaricomes phytoseiuli]MCW1248776.1 methyltransferase domain-containing protein [Acaricomes phytoseiuli]
MPESWRLPAGPLSALRCPVCGSGFNQLIDQPGRARVQNSSSRRPVPQGVLNCESGHRYDLSKYGYANLLTGRANRSTPDHAEMVAARERFLAAGHYEPLRAALASLAAEVADQRRDDPLILDAGCGTGYYLSGVLNARPGGAALALDLSGHALRRAARLPQTAAVAWDLWRPLPVATRSISTVLVVFAPRPLAEFHRVLRPGGALLLASPSVRHLSGLPSITGRLTQRARKQERLAEELAPWFQTVSEHTVREALRLSAAEALDAIAMGPSGHHLDPAEAAAALAEQPQWDSWLEVTIRVLRPLPEDSQNAAASSSPGASTLEA